MIYSKRYLLAVIGVVALAALALACKGGGDGGDGQALVAYFARLGEIQDSFEEKQRALASEYPNAFGNLEDAQASFKASSELFSETFDQVRALEPPEKAKDAHAEFVAAAEKVEELNNELSTRLQDAESESDVTEAFTELTEDEEFNSALTDFAKECADLENIASDNDIEADLGCDYEEEGGSGEVEIEVEPEDGDGEEDEGEDGDGEVEIEVEDDEEDVEEEMEDEEE